MDAVHDLRNALLDSARPVFLFGSTPPREGTTHEEAVEIARKFCARSWTLASDGFVVYDIQDEAGRTSEPRPFPFRKTLDPAGYAKVLSEASGKECVIYKSVVEHSVGSFDDWLATCTDQHGHSSLNLVGAATSQKGHPGPSLPEAAQRVVSKKGVDFGCVTIAERHLKKGNEHLNLVRKMDLGAQWFISQAVYDVEATVKLLNDYGDVCREKGVTPKKIVLTFAPCGRKKTMKFIKWLGIKVPENVEEEIFSSEKPTDKSVEILCNVLVKVLEATRHSGVPLGVNVESVSIIREEIDAAHTLFQSLQRIMLDSRVKMWAVRWVQVGPANRERDDEPCNKNECIVKQPLFVGSAALVGALASFLLLRYRPH